MTRMTRGGGNHWAGLEARRAKPTAPGVSPTVAANHPTANFRVSGSERIPAMRTQTGACVWTPHRTPRRPCGRAFWLAVLWWIAVGWPGECLWAQVGLPTPDLTAAGPVDEPIDPVKIRRLYVPESNLTDFMQDRPTYLPLSAERFRSMLASLQQQQQRIVPAVPLKHWVTVTAAGTLQGYSLLQTNLPTNPGFSDSGEEDTWVSLEDWTMAAEFFNLVPTLSTQRDGGVSKGLWGLPRIEFQEVPLTVAVNEGGVFGVPLTDAAPYLLVRYTVNAAGSAESAGGRLVRLPNSAQTLTLVRTTGASQAGSRFTGRYEEIQSVGASGSAISDDRIWQVVSDRPDLIFPAGEWESPAETRATVARYTEHSTLTLSGSVGRFDSIVAVDFPQASTGELVLELPESLEVTTCEVNGSPQAISQRRAANGTIQILLPWQRWNLTNTIRLAGTLPINKSDRVTIPRVVLPGHFWMQGNLQVTLEAPLLLIDYELVDSCLVSCQTLGTSQNLSFQWGGPQSSVTVVIDASAVRGNSPLPTAELMHLLVDHETMEAEHWLVVPYRHGSTRIGKLVVEEGWQIEQVAALSLRDLPGIRSPAAAENLATPLNWFLDSDTSPVQLNVELPDNFRETEIALRIKASRVVTEWPTRTPGRVVEPLPNRGNGFRPLLLALRGSATLKPTLPENRQWQAVPATEADQQLGVLSGLLGSGMLWLSGRSSGLVLETDSGPVGGYGLLAYTQNQVRPSGMVLQMHRLWVQPSGPVSEVVLRATGERAFHRRWSAWNQAGQAVPFEILWDAEQQEARVQFRTPIIEPVSVVVQQQWDASVPGPLPLWESPMSSTLGGVIDTLSGHGPRLRVWANQDEGPVTDPNRLWEFRQTSRRGLVNWSGPALVGAGQPTEVTGLVFDAEAGATMRTHDFDRSLIYQSPALFTAELIGPDRPWSATTIVQATQGDVWSTATWATELTLELFLDSPDTVVLPVPAGAHVKQVQLNQQPLGWQQTEHQLQVRLETAGPHRLDVVWETPVVPAVPWSRGLIAVPPQVELPTTAPPLDRYLQLPAGFNPARFPASPAGLGLSLSRRLISPLAWPDPHLVPTVVETELTGPRSSAVAGPHSQSGLPAQRGWRRWPQSRTLAEQASWVVSQHDYRVQCWLALLAGWALAFGVSARWVRGFWPWGDPAWWLGGWCLLLAFLATWPIYYLTSTVLLGFLLGHSWCAVWQRLARPSDAGLRRAGPGNTAGNTPQRGPDERSKYGHGSVSGMANSTTLWLLWWLAVASVLSGSQLPGGEVAGSLSVREGPGPSRDGSGRAAAAVQSGSGSDVFHSVVIPVDADRQPSGSVVYVSPELYRQLTELTTNRRRSRDLEIRNVQYTLDYDPQLQRFSQLTSQLTCRTHEARLYRIPYAAAEQDTIRQVRVNGVPVVYQRSGDRIEIVLDAAANLISITSDLQSTGAVTLNATGAIDSAVNLRGIPSGWFAAMTDLRRPTLLVQSATQRRFRVDRLKRVVLSVTNQVVTPRGPNCETWLTVDSQKIDCEMRFSAPQLLGIRNDFYFQVDPRLNLPAGLPPDAGTWTVERVSEEERPVSAAAGPVYRIRFAANHPPEQEVKIPWDFSGRSFGQLAPPWIEFLEQDALKIRHWVVLRVAKNLVYHPQDLAGTAFRRASEFEWRSLSSLGAAGDGSSRNRAPTGVERAADEPALRVPEIIAATDLFVYQVLNPKARQASGVVGRLAWQPVQVAGSLQQQVSIDELTAKVSLKGEIQVTQGELSQWRFTAPAGGKVLQLSWLSGAQNLVAWYTRLPGSDQDDIVVFLRSPISGSIRLDCLYEVPIYTTESPSLPWIQFPAWMDLSQSVQVTIANPAQWKLLGPDWSEARELAVLARSPAETFLVSPESESEIGQLKLARAGEPVATGAVLYLWDSEGPQTVVRLYVELTAKQLIRNITLEQIQGLGLPTTVRAVDANGSPLAVGPWQRSDSGFRAEFADPIAIARLDLEIPVVVGNQEIGLPMVKDGSRDFARYFAATSQEAETVVVGGAPKSLLEEAWRALQPVAERSVWADQWPPARRWVQIDSANREGARLTRRKSAVEGRTATTLGNRFYLRDARRRANSRGVEIVGVQQMVLQTQGLSDVVLQIPAGVELHQGWIDHQRLPLSPESQAGETHVHVSLDPLAEYAVLTLVVSSVRTSGDQKLELVRLPDAESSPLAVTLWTPDGKLPPPLTFVNAGPNDTPRAEESALVIGILEKKFAAADWVAWSQIAPPVHPLRAVAPLGLTPAEAELQGAEIQFDPAEDTIAPATPALAWGVWLVGAAGLVVWIFGVLRPRSLPSPAAWGDVVWILLGSVAWFAAAELALVVLFWTIGFSWLALRAFPDSFSRRVA